MDALDDDDALFAQAAGSALFVTAALGEVVARQHHLFAGDQLIQVLIEQRQVERADALEVGIAEFIERGLVAVDEVVIHADGDRLQTQRTEADGEALGSGGLAGRGGPGDQHQAHGGEICRHRIADLLQLAVVHIFRDQDQLVGLAGADGVVQLVYGGKTLHLQPGVALAHHLLQAQRRREFAALFAKEAAGGQAQHKAVIEGDEAEIGIGRQRERHLAEEVIGELAIAVDGDIGKRLHGKQRRLAVLLGLAEEIDGVIAVDVVAVDGQLLLKQGAHIRFQQGHVIGADGGIVGEAAEYAFFQRMADPQLLAGEVAVHGELQHHLQAAAVDAVARGAVAVQPFHAAVGKERVIQLLHIAVDQRGQRRLGAGGELLQQLIQLDAAVGFDGEGGVVGDSDHVVGLLSGRGVLPASFAFMRRYRPLQYNPVWLRACCLA